MLKILKKQDQHSKYLSADEIKKCLSHGKYLGLEMVGDHNGSKDVMFCTRYMYCKAMEVFVDPCNVWTKIVDEVVNDCHSQLYLFNTRKELLIWMAEEK